jgi:NADH-quinone oxidoreductase subunit A
MRPSDYIPLLVFIVVTIVFGGLALGVPALFGPRKPTATKLDTYESGMLPYGDARRRQPVQYYVVAVLFVLFDIEVILIYPWAVILRKLAWFGLAEMAVFIGILVIGYIYVWEKGALDWK